MSPRIATNLTLKAQRRAAHALLSSEDILAIKELLWHGIDTQIEISRKYGVAQPTISRIFTGKEGGDVPWPDKSLGGISKERRRTIHSSRNRSTRYEHDRRGGRSTLPEETQKEIDKVVEALYSADDSSLLDAMGSASVKKGDKGSGKARQEKKDLLSWPDIREADPSHPLIKEYDKDTNGPGQVAMRMICSKIKQEEWQHPATVKVVREIAKKMEKENDGE